MNKCVYHQNAMKLLHNTIIMASADDMTTEQRIGRSLTEFASDLYAKIAAEQKGDYKNTFFSPISIFNAFAMAMAGAEGETLNEMLKTMHVTKELAAKNVHHEIGNHLLKLFESVPDVDLSIANRLFILKQAEVCPEYAQTLDKEYHSKSEVLVKLPSNEAKREHMNRWVAEQTKKMIPEIIPKGGVTDSDILNIMNALYFKGNWQYPFKKEDTKPQDFHLLDGSTMKVPMMFQKTVFQYHPLHPMKGAAAKFPFGNSKWEMVLVVPDAVEDFPFMISELAKPGALYELFCENFGGTDLEIRIPRFKLTKHDSFDVKKALRACGMNQCFDSGSADFSKMCKDKLHISQVLHQAVLEVDEEGASAAATTPMWMAVRGYSDQPEILADRPFFVVLLYDRRIPVFVGHVVKPEVE